MKAKSLDKSHFPKFAFPKDHLDKMKKKSIKSKKLENIDNEKEKNGNKFVNKFMNFAKDKKENFEQNDRIKEVKVEDFNKKLEFKFSSSEDDEEDG